MSQVLKPIHLFYWQVEFEDGYKLSMFDQEGNEVFIRDICPNESFVNPQDRKTSGILLESNLMGLQERSHGRCTKLSWLPFTEPMKKAIESKQDIEIALLEHPKPISLDIPKDCYPHFYRSTRIEQDIVFTVDKEELKTDVIGARAFVGHLILGFFPRDGRSRRPEIDKINLNEVS